MTKPLHGLWIDDPIQLVRSDSYWRLFRELGFTTAAIFLESFSGGFDPNFDEAALSALRERLHAADVELVLTACPEPRREYLQQMQARIPALLAAAGAAGLEFDLESNWTSKKVVGYPTLQKASEDLVAVTKDIASKLDVRLEVTTFTEHSENGARATVADDADVLVPQGYSVLNRKDQHGRAIEIPFEGHAYSPGAMQRRTFDKALQVPKKNGKPALACGLAAYDQKWPNCTVEEAMRRAYDEALRYQPREVRWWSSKWVIGGKARLPVTQFFRDLAAGK